MMKGTFRFFVGFCLSSLALLVPVGSQPVQKFEQPLLITSAGQSAEVQLVSVLAKRAHLDFTLSKLAAAPELDKVSTLVLSLGVSLKGLGAAGVDINQEKERVSSLLKHAQETDKPLICFHLGGDVRRGQISDEFITDFLPYAKAAIVVKSGNQDGLFQRICQENDILLIEVERVGDALQPFQALFTPQQ
jgi:hypothetical protein